MKDNGNTSASQINPHLVLTVTLLIVVSVALAIFIAGIMEYNGIGRERENIEKDIAAQKQVNEKLEHDLYAEMDDRYIESVARDKLGLVNPDEIIIYDGNGN